MQYRVYGIPKAQPRPRATARNGFAHVYNPGTADEWKSAVAACVGIGETTDGPVKVTITFYMPISKATLKRLKYREQAPHTSKPDIDNLIKSTLDAMVDIGRLKDDASVWTITASKIYATGFLPGASITIEETT